MKMRNICLGNGQRNPDLIINTIRQLGIRAKQLRVIKVKKTFLLHKLMESSLAVSKDWRKSKFCLVISAVYAHLYQIDGCIRFQINICCSFRDECCVQMHYMCVQIELK